MICACMGCPHPANCKCRCPECQPGVTLSVTAPSACAQMITFPDRSDGSYWGVPYFAPCADCETPMGCRALGCKPSLPSEPVQSDSLGGLNIDMIDAQYVRDVANRLRRDIGFMDPAQVADHLDKIADGMEQEVRDVGMMRARLRERS